MFVLERFYIYFFFYVKENKQMSIIIFFYIIYLDIYTLLYEMKKKITFSSFTIYSLIKIQCVCR